MGVHGSARVMGSLSYAMSCNKSYESNSIIGKPSSRVLSTPGGSSTLSLGQDIDTSSANQDKDDNTAIAFLQETQAKYAAEGKLSVGDLTKLCTFPLFDEVLEKQLNISSMPFTEKRNVGDKVMMGLASYTQGAPQAPAPAAPQANVSVQQAPLIAGGQTMEAPQGGSGTQCVGSVTQNSIGDIPSVKLHAPPGGTSSITFG